MDARNGPATGLSELCCRRGLKFFGDGSCKFYTRFNKWCPNWLHEQESISGHN